MKKQLQLIMKATVKMTMLVFLVMAFSCSPETTIDTDPNGAENLKMVAAKGKKAKPIKAKLFNFPDPNQTVEDLLLCAPGFPLTRNIINGNMSHLGKLQPGSSFDEVAGVPISGSYGVPTSCIPNADLSSLKTEFDVYYVAANGDLFVTKEFVTIDFNLADFPDYTVGTFTNTLDANGDPMPIEIVSGTGRFDGATGELYFVDASFGPEGTFWELVGKITY